MIVIQNDENANRDNEIAAIFNPKRVRTPSVVVTGDSPNGPSPFPTSNVHQITHSDSVTSSQPDGAESLTGVIIGDNALDLHSHHQPNSLTQIHQHQLPRSASIEHDKPKGCKASCCSELAQKMYFGVCVTILITFFWVGTTHCFKFLFLPSTILHPSLHHTTSSVLNKLSLPYSSSFGLTTRSPLSSENFTVTSTPGRKPTEREEHIDEYQFRAPFFASWFCTNFVILFFPIYLMFRGLAKKCGANTETLGDILQGFRDRGFTIGRFINRCITFCILWVVATYLYMKSLNALNSTDVIVLFATNVASVYLLSWVILHEQFVGVRIVAVILVDTGIALLAYMDGITGSKTLASVVLAALSGACYAVFRVMFRKMMGDPPPVGRIAFTFTIIGIINAAMLWPVCLILYFSDFERMPLETLTFTVLMIASTLLLSFHILTQFSGAVTYQMFVTLGLITSVPVSASLDILLYGAEFTGMKLGGIILISVGFFLVMFPNNWPDYITRLLSCRRELERIRIQIADFDENIHVRAAAAGVHDPSLPRRRLAKYHPVRTSTYEMEPFKKRSASIHWSHRLSHGIHSFPSSLAQRKSTVALPVDLFADPNFDLNNYYIPSSLSNRNSITETNFVGLSTRMKSAHRDSYASLD